MDFTRSRKRHGGLDLTPLIDVVFLLIVFLILTANFQQPSLSLELPGGTSEDESHEQVVLVELDAMGQLALDGTPVDKSALGPALEAALAETSKRAVRLFADEEVSYGDLLPIIEQVRASGAEAVDLVHQVRR